VVYNEVAMDVVVLPATALNVVVLPATARAWI